MTEQHTHEAGFRPATATAIMVVLSAVAEIYCLLTTGEPDPWSIPLVLAPLLALYWLARYMSGDTASGWMIFGAGFIIVAPMVMFLLVLAVSSRGGVDPDLGISFPVLVGAGPIVQLLAVALLFPFARMMRK